MPSFITFQDFTFKYDAQAEPTLKDISLTIEKGEKVLIVGPSGSGKSTLAQCLNGIIPNNIKGQREGQVLINGQDVFNLSIYEKSHYVSTVLQDPDTQFVGLTVAEDLAFSLENDMVSFDEMTTRIGKWSDRLNLGSLLMSRPQDLSGGQKQRVSLAGVLIDESPILLFDEPLANLDPKAGQDTIALIDKIHQENDVTTIIIEHRLEDVLYRPVDKIVLINDGRIIFDGTPDDLLRTNLLKENGIREPLYISVLRDLGYDLENMSHLASLEKLELQKAFSEPVAEISHEKGDKVLSVKDIRFAYQSDKPILNDLSVDFFKGEKVAIVGKNGTGKSTFAKSLCQLLIPEGEIYYKGELVSDDTIKERAEKIGYVLQNPNQMISQTMIFDEVALGLRYRNFSEDEIQKRVEHALKVCGLHAFRKWPISALSFGQKKRVTIASILVLEPDVIILDEPTAGQDQKNYTEMMFFLEELSQLGHTIMLITHDMQLLLEYTDRVLVIDDGAILLDTPSEALFQEEEVLDRAHLKKTSLFALAEKLSADPLAVTQYYIRNQRRTR